MLRTLAAQAWADGDLKPSERAFLEAIAHAGGLRQSKWQRWLDEPTPPPPIRTLQRYIVDPNDRLDLVTQMLALSWVDQVVSPEEWALVEAVGVGLDVPLDTLQALLEELEAA